MRAYVPATAEPSSHSAAFTRTRKAKTIFVEGATADRIYFFLGAGEPVGAVAAFESRAFPASAVATERSTLLSIPEREFFQLIESRPAMTRHLLGGLTMRLMMLNKRMADMTGTVEHRAVRLFLTLAARMGTARDGATFIALPLSRQELADFLGTTLETTIRLMSRWQKEQKILTQPDGFVVPSLEALRGLGDE